MRNISIIINARVNSSRVERKILRDFSGSSLLDICLNKMSELIKSGYKVYLATCEDEILKVYKKYEKTGIKIIDRDKGSVEKGFRDQQITFAHYKMIPSEYIMSINICSPFAKFGTYLEAIGEFDKSNAKTLTSVKKKNNIFFDSELKKIGKISKSVSTQTNDPVYEMAHVFHIFDKKQFLDTGTFWDYTENNPHLFAIQDSVESLDIDTEIDFQICNFLYGKLYENTSF